MNRLNEEGKILIKQRDDGNEKLVKTIRFICSQDTISVECIKVLLAIRETINQSSYDYDICHSEIVRTDQTQGSELKKLVWGLKVKEISLSGLKERLDESNERLNEKLFYDFLIEKTDNLGKVKWSWEGAK